MARRMKIAMLLFAAGACLPLAAATAETIRAASCGQADVQKAIDAAKDGDVVQVPEGAATWKSDERSRPAVLIENKAITLRGAGIDKTVITDGSTMAWVDLLLWIRGPKPARVTGFTFIGVPKQNDGAAAVAVHGSARDWRIDHCKFDRTSRGVWAYDDSFGLIDHCAFVQNSQGVATKGRGEKSWSEPLMLGLPDAVYIEDCTFDGVLYVTDAFHGARFVFRHNSVSRGAVANHGLDSGGYRSTFSMEIYDNVLTYDIQQPWASSIGSRGGTGVVFNNQITGYSSAITVNNYRSSVDDEGIRKLCASWGMADGTNPLDGNEEPNGYPALDQIGRATHQILEPMYEWNNTINHVRWGGIGVHHGPQHIQEGRDYYNNTLRPGYKPYTYPHPLQGQWPPGQDDRETPAIPAGLRARAAAERDVELTWQASTDNLAVAGYFVWLNGARVTAITDPEHTRYTFRRLKLPLEQHTFAVSAFDAARNESQESAPVKAAQ